MKRQTVRLLGALGWLWIFWGTSGCGQPSLADGDLRLELDDPRGDGSDVTVRLAGPGLARVKQRISRRPPEQFLYVVLDSVAGAPTLAPLLARTEELPSALQLRPLTTLTRGLKYRAVFAGDQIGLPRLEKVWECRLDPTPGTGGVARIFPALPEVPVNLLKFYLHFRTPMAEGRLFQHLVLLNPEGKPVTDAFREVELWDDPHRRLTVWIHPGRTKEALGLSESLGPVLHPGRSYTLVLRPGLRDQQGKPLTQEFRHRFRTVAADRTCPDPNQWRISLPEAGTADPLRVHFPETLDQELAQKLLGVNRARARIVAARVSVSQEGRSWEFVPRHPWTTGSYQLIAGGDLEDLAGNNLYRPFETSPGDHLPPTTHPPTRMRTFVIR